MKIQFCGAARTVTGSCYYVDTGNLKFLVDCGAFQGGYELERLNYQPLPFNPAELDFVIVTHAHYDHVGRLPLLTKQGFKGRILSTQPTRDLAKIVLLDSAHIQEEEYKRWKAKAKRNEQSGFKERPPAADYDPKPLYSEAEVEEVMALFEVHPYGNSIQVSDCCEMRMRDAGHILGSSSIELWLTNGAGRKRKIVFSGDLGQPGARIIKDPDMIREADYVIVESTYGNRLHKNKDETVLELLAILTQVQKQQGVALMPTFAIERAQELIYELNLFYENKLLSKLPVYLDSPMAIKATEVFRRYPGYYDEDAKRLMEKGDDPFDFQGFHMVKSVDESKRLIDKRGIVIMAGSGMMTGGRIVHHAINHLGNSKTHLIFAGFQVEGTLGRMLVDGEPEVRIRGQKVNVKAKVHTLGGFSAHADERDLRYWLRGFGHTPKRVFMVHGEESVSLEFAKNIKQELKIDTYVPNLNEVVELD